MIMNKVCEHCHDPFEAKRIDTRHCSRSCRQMAYINRKAPKAVNYPSIDESEKHSKASTIPAKSSIDVTQEFAETSDNHSLSVNTSIDGTLRSDNNKQETVNKTSITEDAEAVNKQNDAGKIDVSSQFIDALSERDSQSKYIYWLLLLFEQDKTGATEWVSLRYRCLLECLLTFSEMKQTEMDDLKELCNAFTDLTGSKCFTSLHEKYLYKTEIISLNENIRKICLKNEDVEYVKVQLCQETKVHLMVCRYELAHFVPYMAFNELNFMR